MYALAKAASRNYSNVHTDVASLEALGLVERTEAVVRDDELRARLSEAAEARAREFSVEAFAERFGAVVRRVVSGQR